MPEHTIRKKLIEVSIPLEAINKASKKQKAPKGYPTAIHKYWAQRPIAACRGVLFAQLVDDPSSWPDRFPTEKDQDKERARLHRVIERMVPWEASNNETILNEARWEIARSVAWGLGEEPPPQQDTRAILDYLQTKAPPVYDPFSGGASIPLEAQRLGLRAFGSDLNPVAVLIGKALVEIPPKFAGLPPVNPKAQAELKHSGGIWTGKGAQGLAEDVRYYGQWMRDEAEKRIGHLYPKAKLADGSEATVIAWLWARTVRSPDPAAKGAMVPLASTFMLSTKEGKKAWVEVVTDESAPHGWRFEVKSGKITKDDEKKLKNGTKSGRGSNFVCVLTGSAIRGEHIKEQGKAGHLESRLMAVVAQVGRSRTYLAPTADHEDILQLAHPSIDVGDLATSTHSQYMGCVPYGLDNYRKLFTSRQLLSMETLTDLVSEARIKVTSDVSNSDTEFSHCTSEYANAIATYLAFVVDREADYGSSLTTWLTDDNAIRGTFGRQALPMVWDYCEGNCFGDSSAALTTIIKTVCAAIEHQQATTPGVISQIDAAKNGYPAKPCVINCDPPYYDNIPYADLSDYFYVWMKRSLKSVWPDLFRTVSVPKSRELVADVKRHDGRENAESFFMKGMGEALMAMRVASTDSAPTAIYYAFKQSEADQNGITSAGWASFLQAVVNAGMIVDATWPLRTESAGRMRGNNSNALASSIVLVCRKRPADAPVITRADFIRLLKRELPEAIDDIRKAGVGPVDMQQSVIGPGMGVFSRHARVLEDDDSAMSVKTALAIINRIWGEIENEADASLDPESQVALAWFASYGFDAKPSGELITLANAKNVGTDALYKSGVFTDLRGRAELTARAKLPEDWSPAADATLTIWECVQHAARVFNAEDGGEIATARMIAEMGSHSREAHVLAGRLFQIATDKGWAQEALVYNELATIWPKLEALAGDLAAAAPVKPTQTTLDL